MKDVKRLAQIWWTNLNVIQKEFLETKYYPNLHYSDIKDNQIEYMYKKEVK